MKKIVIMLLYVFGSQLLYAQSNTFPASGNVGIGTTNPLSAITIKQLGTGVSIHPIGNPYFGAVAFNREVSNGQIYDSNAQAFQINNGGPDKNLHVQVYNGNGSIAEQHALVISGINGDIGIGTANPKEKLSVNGKIRAHEIKVETANWPDYVFEQDYKILGLKELDAYIKANKRLPEMPSAAVAEKDGVGLGELNKLLLKKVEELTLLLIEQNKLREKDSKRISELEKRNNTLNK